MLERSSIDTREIETNSSGPFLAIARAVNDIHNTGTISSTETFNVLDSEWSKGAFFLGAEHIDDEYNKALLFVSKADTTWMDTTIGGNLIMNPKPQYTRYSDPRRKGVLKGRLPAEVSYTGNNLGMGRQYSEYIQDAIEPTYLRFGILESGSFINYITNYANPELTSIHVHGVHAKEYSRYIGRVVGAGATLALTAWVVNPVAALVLGALSWAVYYIKTYLVDSSTDFYSLKPMMHLYWSAVNNMVNTLLIEEGFIWTKNNANGKGPKREIDQGQVVDLKKTYPELFTPAGVDVSAVISKANRRHQKHLSTFELALKDIISNPVLAFTSPAQWGDQDGVIESLLNMWNQSKANHADEDTDPTPPSSMKTNTLSPSERLTPEEIKKMAKARHKSQIEKIAEGDSQPIKDGKDEYESGTAFAILGFDHVTGLSDSFSNSTTHTRIGGLLNAPAKVSRDLRYEFGGVRRDADVITDVLRSFGGMYKGIVEGLEQGINSVTLGIPGAVKALLSGTEMDVPEHWDESTINLATVDFTTTLMINNQHPLARITGLYIPLAMMVTAVAPRQTGLHSRTGPYMCSAFIRGKINIKMGVVSSLRIERQAMNLTADERGRPLAFKVTMSIKDLTPMSSMLQPSPIVGLSDADLLSLNTGDSGFNRWLRTLAGRGIEDDLFGYQKSAIRRTYMYNLQHAQMSPAYRAQANLDADIHNSLLSTLHDAKMNLKYRNRNMFGANMPASLGGN